MTAAAPGDARRCAVLGHPVGHSLSPLLHRTAYAVLGLDWTYDAHDVTPDGLAGFLDRLDPSWRGLSLTMPLKRAVLPLLDDLDDTGRAVGAVNTVLLDGAGRHGANTDVPGLVAALRAAGLSGPGGGRGVVVGGGATAASALAALVAVGVTEVQVRVREPARADDTLRTGRRLGVAVRVARLDEPWPGAADVLVSTVPSPVAAALLPEAALADGIVADVVYDPWPSPLLARAARAGARTASGIDLLVHQAVEQLRLMTERAVDPAVLLAAATAAVQEQGGAGPGDGYPRGP